MYDPELPVVEVKKDVTNNKDEQEENDTLVPAWLTRLRDRRMREVEARTAEEADKVCNLEPLVLEVIDKDGRSKSHGKSSHQGMNRDKRDNGKGAGPGGSCPA